MGGYDDGDIGSRGERGSAGETGYRPTPRLDRRSVCTLGLVAGALGAGVWVAGGRVAGGSAGGLSGGLAAAAPAVRRARRMTLLDAPIELIGDWGHIIPDAAKHVVERMRHACLDGVRLLSDGQPTGLRVDEHRSGPPAIWLHAEPRDAAWIIVDVGDRDWSKLAYQFGHELGHVVANSWKQDAKPAAPCQWLEEAMVEAFALRGLARVADDWSRNPPFTDDSGFGAALSVYRQNIVEQYGKLAAAQGHPENLAAWFKANRAHVEAPGGLHDYAKAAALALLFEYERDPVSLEALGAVNRWPGRSGIPLAQYIKEWRTSCRDLGASTALPEMLESVIATG